MAFPVTPSPVGNPAADDEPAGAVPVHLPDGERTAPPRLTWRRLGTVVGLFALSRLLVLWAARAADASILAKGPMYAAGGNRAGHAGASLTTLFDRWDTDWYRSVVQQGYFYNPANPGHSNVPFYPLYPLLVKGMNLLLAPFGVGVLSAGYLVSNLELALACAVVWKLAALEFGTVSAANRAVALLVLAPGSVWFSMFYSESTFLLFLALTMLWCRQRRWGLAALAGYAVALSRTPGLLAAGFLAVEALAEWRARRRLVREAGAAPFGSREWTVRALAVAAPALGHATWLGFLQVRFGDWRAQAKAAAAGWPDTGFHARAIPVDPALWWTVVPVAVAAVALLVWTPVALRRRWAYPALALALMGLYFLTTNPNRLPRYLSVVLPLGLTAAWLGERSRTLEVGMLTASAALLTLITALLVAGYNIN